MNRRIRFYILLFCLGGAVLAGLSARWDRPEPVAEGSPASREPGGGHTIVESTAEPVDDHSTKADPAGLPGVVQPRHRVKTAEELKVEELIDSVFRTHFKDYQIAGRSLTIRMPFGLNNEREGSPGYRQTFFLGGKGTPGELWPAIDSVLASGSFNRYFKLLSGPGEKAIVFDLERKAYSLSQDQLLIERLKQGSYPGTPTRVYVYRNEPGLLEADIYNYLYAVAAVGVDCSGFTHFILQSVALAYGLDLNRTLAESWHISPNRANRNVGLWFYDPPNGYTEAVSDRVEDLRPGDILLFRGHDGGLKHSAVIQSIDFVGGFVRYVQSTDWAPQAERGVHGSTIRFYSFLPPVSLKHHAMRWMQQVRPPFEGEEEPRDWRTDGDRYLWYPEGGGSLVVRLQKLKEAILVREPRYYTNLSGGEATVPENAPLQDERGSSTAAKREPSGN